MGIELYTLGTQISKCAFSSSHKIPHCSCTGENRWKQPHTCPEVKWWKMKEELPPLHCSLDRLSAPGCWTNFTEMANTGTACHPCWDLSRVPARWERGHCQHHTTGSKHQREVRAARPWPEPDCPGPAAPSASKLLTVIKRCPTDTRSTEQTSGPYVTHSPWQWLSKHEVEHVWFFVARIVSTKKVRKRVDRQLRKAGFKFLVYHRVFVWPQWSCLFPARLSNISVGGAEEKYMKNQEVSGYTGVPKSSRLAYLYI